MPNPAASDLLRSALAARGRGRDDEALGFLKRAVSLEPSSPQAHANLGSMLGLLGRHDRAADCFRRALALWPDYPQAHQNLGVALEHLRRLEEAAASQRRAIELRPDYPEAWHHLGNALRKLGDPAEAEGAHRRALGLRPDYADALGGLAAALSDLGRAEEAVPLLRRRVQLQPASAAAHSDLLVHLHFLDGVTPEQLFAEHLTWAETHGRASGDTGGRGWLNDPDRRLRVGYVSPDFRSHPVPRFFEPLLEHHDCRAVEIFCYSDVPPAREDGVTRRLRGYGHAWRDVAGLPDARVAEAVRRDRVDVLVDLAGHMANPRLTVFALRPAPVQVTYLGYPDTTGLGAVDWRVTDAAADPPGLTDRFHAEKLYRLGGCAGATAPPAAVRRSAHSRRRGRAASPSGA